MTSDQSCSRGGVCARDVAVISADYECGLAPSTGGEGEPLSRRLCQLCDWITTDPGSHVDFPHPDNGGGGAVPAAALSQRRRRKEAALQRLLDGSALTASCLQESMSMRSRYGG